MFEIWSLEEEVPNFDAPIYFGDKEEKLSQLINKTMYLSKFRVENYKSFRDSGEIEFKPGINIIVGQNNSGKTALLEAIESRSETQPHKSVKEISTTESKVEITLNITRDEIEKLFPPEVILPGSFSTTKAEVESRFNIFVNEGGEVKAERNFRQPFDISNTLYKSDSMAVGVKLRKVPIENKRFENTVENSRFEYKSTQEPAQIEQAIWHQLFNLFVGKVYRFNAERPNLGESPMGVNRELDPNASLLAQVLLNAKSHNEDLFARFRKNVFEVLPSIKGITTVLIHGGQTHEIRIWTTEIGEREELMIPLSQCGTGIGQVLAILYVVVTSKEPRTIIIDEPNSFLHPSAAKKLITILSKKEFSHHQYFISTHSPEIVTTANASTITMLRYGDGETIAEQLDLSTGNDKLKLVEELGMEMSDFFFAENVLWVEGPTEAKAFPMILKESESVLNFVAVPLVSTDDLKDRKKGRKHAKTNIKNYEILSGKYALTPPNIFTVLDREDTDDREIQDLQKLGIEFIPRRMYENYLLDEQAITEVLNSEMFDETDKITIEQVQEMLDSSSAEYEDKTKWLAEVHSANLLENIFSELSKKTVEYRKTIHSVELTKWFSKHKPEQLKELQDFLLALLNKY